MKSKMCDGCPKVMTNTEDGIHKCWFDCSKIGFWNDLMSGFECDYYEYWKSQNQECLNKYDTH